MPKPLTIEVTFAHSVERDGWHNEPHFGGVRCYGVHDKEFELRAAVTFYGVNDVPEVAWLDEAAVEDLDLTGAELEGAEEQAIEAACDVLRKRHEQDNEATVRADHLLDQRKDDALRGVA